MKENRQLRYLVAAVVALVTCGIHLASLGNGFLEWDDGTYVVENPQIRALDGAFFRWAFFDFHGANWHPLTWLSHALDYAVWGLDPRGHHLTNVLLHALVTFVVALLTVRLMAAAREQGGPAWLDERGSIFAGGVTALLFGLHPLHVESVAWVAERKDLLCALFYLLGIGAYLRYVASRPERKGQEPAGPWARPYLAALALFILALMSKPMAVSLPVVLLILDWYPLRRIAPSRPLLPVLAEKIPFVALALASSVVTVFAQQAGGAVVATTVIPLGTRLIVALTSLCAYLGKMIAPVGLLPFYAYPRSVALLSPATLGAFCLVAAITAGAIAAAKRERLWLAAWGWYVVTLLPVIGIVQVGRQAMADRYTYLPSLAPFIVFGLLAARGAREAGRRPLFRPLPAIAGAALFAGLAYGTVRQIGVWKDGTTLWGAVIDRYRGNEDKVLGLAFVYSNRGIALHRQHRYKEAVADFTKAIELDPKDDAYYKNRGTSYLEQRNFDLALADFRRAIELAPASGGAYYNIACIHALRGDSAEACRWLAESIAHGYADWELIRNDSDLDAIRGASCYGEIMKGR